jgi:23S rRNA (cytidine2498-2'-O)-methyltransferase
VPAKSSPRLVEFEFAFAVCQLGAEPALKAEVARAHPSWRFAFSRPGLITWRTGTPIAEDFALSAIFARAFGASLGRAESLTEALAFANRLAEQGDRVPLVLHVFERDQARPGEEETLDAPGQLAEKVRAELLATAPPDLFVIEPRAPRFGERVLDVIVAPDEPLWIGFHRHHAAHSPFPGGRVPLQLPAEAPSRAWLKLEEALAWSHLPLRRGQVAVEIGSAPGGASWALLQRGLRVVGVDPGQMAPQVLSASGFSHLQVSLGELRREALPETVDWLLMDVNLAPQVALHGVRRIVSTLRPHLRGVIFTLKLNDWKMAAEVSELCARIAGMGLEDVRATQLTANRREICVIASSARQARRYKSADEPWHRR